MSDDANQNTAPADDSAPDQQPVSPEAFKKTQERAQRLEAQLKDAEKRYNQFASIYKDIDPDEAKSLKAKLEEAERKAAEKDPAKLEEMLDRKWNKKLQEVESKYTPVVQEVEQLRKENKTLKVTDKPPPKELDASICARIDDVAPVLAARLRAVCGRCNAPVRD